MAPSYASLLAILASAGCSASPDVKEATGLASQAWNNRAFTDDDTLEANVVVRLSGSDGGSCTGTLISPTAVLTAKHCITGWAGLWGHAPGMKLPIAVGVGNPIVQTRWVSTRSQLHPYQNFDVVYTTNGLDDDETGFDVAILFLDSPALPFARIVRPSLVSPFMGGRDDNGGLYAGPIGFAGWAAEDSLYGRQVVLFNSVTLHHYPGMPDAGDGTPSGQYWDYDGSLTKGHDGDSGGPMFKQLQDGTRSVIGVYSGKGWPSAGDCGVGACELFVDVTRGVIARFIRDTMIDTTPYGPRWRAMHAARYWRGEVDYTGPVRAGDWDGDHWFDENDNCPRVPNTDQADGDDDGRGDACPPVPPSGPPVNCSAVAGCSDTVYVSCDPSGYRMILQQWSPATWKWDPLASIDPDPNLRPSFPAVYPTGEWAEYQVCNENDGLTKCGEAMTVTLPHVSCPSGGGGGSQCHGLVCKKTDDDGL